MSTRLAEAKLLEPKLGKLGKVGGYIVADHLKEPPLIIKEIRNGRNAVSGLLIQTFDDNVIIDVTETSPISHIDFANKLSKSEIEIEDGTLMVIVDGVKKRCREVGVFEDLEATPGRLVLPGKFKIPKIETLASKDDSFGKAKWRAELKDFFLDSFPKGLSQIHKEERKVMMFPGLGKEAELWAELGFDEENMFFIEEDSYIADEVMKKFPKANMFTMNLEKNLATFNRFIGDNQFSVVNIDPESQMTMNFSKAIGQFKKKRRATGLIAYNFYALREKLAVQNFYRSVNSHVANYHSVDKKGVDPDDLVAQRESAVRNLLNYSWCDGHCGGAKRPIDWAKKTHSGSYESSGGGKMIYSMHKILR